jgi:hypothetical protein
MQAERAHLTFDARGDWMPIAQAVATQAVVLVRNLFDPDILQKIRARLTHTFDRVDREAALGLLPDANARLREVSVSLPASDIFIPEGSAETLLTHPLAKAIAGLVLKAEPATRFAYFRRMDTEEPDIALPYHQDQTVVEQLWKQGRDFRLMNMWVPLDPSGGDRPGLELIDSKIEDLIPPGPPTGNMLGNINTEIPVDVIRNRFGNHESWVPRTEVGDALFFHGTTVHRTALLPGMRGRRISLDIRYMSYDGDGY